MFLFSFQQFWLAGSFYWHAWTFTFFMGQAISFVRDTAVTSGLLIVGAIAGSTTGLLVGSLVAIAACRAKRRPLVWFSSVFAIWTFGSMAVSSYIPGSLLKTAVVLSVLRVTMLIGASR